MSRFLAMLKKEWLEQKRTGRLMLLGLLFLLLGIMNPAIAKLTPWLLETMADSLAESGMSVSAVTVDALTSWTQFFKNLPLGLIAFLLVESGILTRESQSGTLIPVLTKGLSRPKVIAAKTLTLVLLWTACYWLCFGITYGYNAYFWDNAQVRHLLPAVTIWWLFGLWCVTLTMLFSAIANSSTGVLAGTGASVLAAYLLSLFPRLKPYSPAALLNGTPLVYGIEEPDYLPAVLVTLALSAAALAASIPLFNRKQL